MPEFNGQEGDFVRLIALPMSNIARAIAEIRERKEELDLEELDAALRLVVSSAERISALAVSADNQCRNCKIGRSQSALERVIDEWEVENNLVFRSA